MKPKLLYGLRFSVLRNLDASPAKDVSRARTTRIDLGYRPEGSQKLVRLHDHRVRAYSLQSRKLGVAPETALEAHICLGQPIIRRRMVPEEAISDVFNRRQYTDRRPDAAELR
jgi:hypothetical protein